MSSSPHRFLFRIEVRGDDIYTEAEDDVGDLYSGTLMLCNRPDQDRSIQPRQKDILHEVTFKDGYLVRVDQTQAELIEVRSKAGGAVASSSASSSSSSSSSSSPSSDVASSSSSSSSSPSTFVVDASLVRGDGLVFYQRWQIVGTQENITSNQQYVSEKQPRLLSQYKISPERLESERQRLLRSSNGILSLRPPAAGNSTPTIKDVKLTALSDDLGRRLHGEFAEKDWKEWK